MRIISIFLIVVFSFAKVQIFSTKITKKKGIIYISNPLIIYKDFIIQAKKGRIKNKIIYLEENVVAFYKNSNYLAKKATIYSKKDIFLKDILLIDKESEIWIKAKNAKYNNDLISLKNIIFSSCCVNRPDWFLYSSYGSYNKKSKYIKLYNLVLYINDVPVLYFPFYFNNFDKTRRSGFLRPYLGFSVIEGILYSQPFYLTLGRRADFEITPTIRSLRGRGIYNTFRFVTSPFDYGEIKFGEFIDKNSYIKKYNLANKKHYGYEIIYKRSNIIGNDKIYVNFKKANDMDYFYLNPYNYNFDTKYLIDKLVTSKLNYINEFSNDYIIGIYNKYFLDTTKKHNDNTIQILPQFNFHKFEDKNFILNSFDFKYYNYYSKYKKYYQYTLDIPLSYNFSFFDNFLKVKIGESFNYLRGNYYNTNKPTQEFYQIYSSIKIFSSITKKGSFVHVFNPSLTFNFKQKSFLSKEHDLLTYSKTKNSGNFKLFQLFEKKDFYLDDTLIQNIDTKFKPISNLENYLNLKYRNIRVSNNNKYNWRVNRIIYNAFSSSINFEKFYFSFYYIFKYPVEENVSKSYVLGIEKSVNKFKKYYLKYNYDLINKFYKYVVLGVKLNKKCWKYNLSFKKERIPILTEGGVSYNKNYMVTLNINFYPIGGLAQSIQFK